MICAELHDLHLALLRTQTLTAARRTACARSDPHARQRVVKYPTQCRSGRAGLCRSADVGCSRRSTMRSIDARSGEQRVRQSARPGQVLCRLSRFRAPACPWLRCGATPAVDAPRRSAARVSRAPPFWQQRDQLLQILDVLGQPLDEGLIGPVQTHVPLALRRLSLAAGPGAEVDGIKRSTSALNVSASAAWLAAACWASFTARRSAGGPFDFSAI